MGATFSLPEKDRWGYARKWLLATMRVLCGGRIAEERATGDVASGAAMDIAQVTNLARKMILEWGMSDKLGFVRYEGADTREMFMPDKEFSEDTAKMVDSEVRRLIDEAYADAKRIIEANWDKVVSVAEALLTQGTGKLGLFLQALGAGQDGPNAFATAYGLPLPIWFGGWLAEAVDG